MLVVVAADVGWTAAQTAIVIVAVIAIAGSVVSASITFWLTQRVARRERRAIAFAEALATVEDYAELPYRIRRRLDTTDGRHALAEEASSIQSRLAYFQALLQIEAPGVAAAYANLVSAAKTQAGVQMTAAWNEAAPTDGAGMNLGVRLDRNQIDDARHKCVRAMRIALRRSRPIAAPPIPTAVSGASGSQPGPTLPAAPAAPGP